MREKSPDTGTIRDLCNFVTSNISYVYRSKYTTLMLQEMNLEKEEYLLVTGTTCTDIASAKSTSNDRNLLIFFLFLQDKNENC